MQKCYVRGCEKFLEIFTKVQNLSTKAPLFEVKGSRLPVSQPSQVLQRPKTVAIIRSTFERNLDKEAEVIARRVTSITPTDPEPQPLAAKLTGGEEQENMEDINREIDQLFSDLDSPPRIDNPPLDHTSTNPITPNHSPTPSAPPPNSEPLIQPAAPEPPPPLVTIASTSELSTPNQPEA